MIYRHCHYCLILALLLISVPLSAQTPNFEKLKEKFDRGLVFKAYYVHEFTDSYTKEVMVSEGNIWIDHVGYKLESEDQTVVVDGETSRVYDSTRNRVIISEYDPETDDFAPSRMLNGVDSTYVISEQRLDNGSRITLKSEDDFSVFTRVEILIDQQQRPLEITAYDISENVIVTKFSNGVLVEVDDSVFGLNFPESAEIIDMRY